MAGLCQGKDIRNEGDRVPGIAAHFHGNQPVTTVGMCGKRVEIFSTIERKTFTLAE
jgi:hypothetical protein